MSKEKLIEDISTVYDAYSKLNGEELLALLKVIIKNIDNANDIAYASNENIKACCITALLVKIVEETANG